MGINISTSSSIHEKKSLVLLLVGIVLIQIPVSENASDTAENTGISISEYPSLVQLWYRVISYSLNGTQLLPS